MRLRWPCDPSWPRRGIAARRIAGPARPQGASAARRRTAAGRARLPAVALAVLAAGFGLRPAVSRAAAPAGGLSVTPSVLAGIPGTTATVWVGAPARATIATRIYGFDPASGRLSPPAAGEAAWLRIAPASGAGGMGRAERFEMAFPGPPAPPGHDTYLDVVFLATVPAGAGAGARPELAAGTIVAFRGTAPPPAGWAATLTGPGVLWLGGASWRVQVRGGSGGFIAPEVRAEIRGRSSAVQMGPVLPGASGEARVRLRGGGLPGLAVLRVQVRSGAGSVTLRRRVLVLPGAGVLGALGGLCGAGGAAAWLRGRGKGREGRRP